MCLAYVGQVEMPTFQRLADYVFGFETLDELQSVLRMLQAWIRDDVIGSKNPDRMVVIAYIVDRIEYAYTASKPPAGARTFTSSVDLASMRHEINVFERSVETDLNRLLGGGNSEHYDSYVDAWNQPTQFRGGIPWDLLTLPGAGGSEDDNVD